MKAYCLDTSGFSSPLEFVPEDIHSVLWGKISGLIANGKFAVNAEIYEELMRLPGAIGECICAHKDNLQLEIEEEGHRVSYLGHVERMKDLRGRDFRKQWEPERHNRLE